MHDILVDLHLVGVANQRIELYAEFVLRRCDFVVMLFNHNAHFSQNRQHFRTHVLQAVNRRYWEIAALYTWAVAEIACLVICIVIGRQFRRIKLEACIVGIGLVLHVIKDEEFRLWPNENRIANARCLQIGFGLLGSAAWVTIVSFARNRVQNIADHHHGGLRKEWVHVHGCRIGHENHVGFVDCLPATDGGAVKHDAVSEHVFVDCRDVHRYVMQLTLWIGEAQVHELDVILLDLLHDVACGRHGISLESMC